MKMKTYLEEDLQLVRKYFPGARAVTLRTPFDLTNAPEDPWKGRTDDHGVPSGETEWYGDLAWNR